MHKPIVRWTISNCNNAGIESLKYAINYWNQLFPKKFDLFVCYNQLNENKLREIAKLPVQLINQAQYVDELICRPQDTAWKLYPPRLDVNRHEIFIDNDLVIYKSFKELEEFLVKDIFIVTSAHRRFYGFYDFLITSKQNINTGFFGLPPGFDLKSKLNNLLELFEHKWEDHSDEEGALMVLMQKLQTRIIPMETIFVCNPNLNFANYKKGTSGTHFASLNSGKTKYWDQFKSEPAKKITFL